MATDPRTVDHLLGQLAGRGVAYTTRRMFGEYCLYRDGLPVALICDDMLFVKDSTPGRGELARLVAPELGVPYPGARPHLRLAPDAWEDGESLRRLLDVTAAALPPRRAKPTRGSRSTPRPGGKPAPTPKPATPSSSAAGRSRGRASPARNPTPPKTD